MAERRVTYWDYIKTEELLSLQGGLPEDDSQLSNDEVMFITVHQIDELWFKLVLRELASVRDLFAQPRVPEQALSSAVRGIRRMAVVFDKLANHFELMETLTTRDYLGFRDKLSGASGFQSAQLREVEILLGLEDSQRIGFGHESSFKDALYEPDGSPSAALERVQRREQDTPTLHEAIRQWLWRTPIQGSTPDEPDDEDVVRRFIDDYARAHAREVSQAQALSERETWSDDDRRRLQEAFDKEAAEARAFLLAEDRPEDEREQTSRIRAALVFIESYRELPLLAWPREVVDSLVAFEQSMIVFRQRHARMVERVIGRRTGTGGSAGVDYLDQTALTYRIFGDIWAVRTLLIKQEALPAVQRADVYGLAPGD